MKKAYHRKLFEIHPDTGTGEGSIDEALYYKDILSSGMVVEQPSRDGYESYRKGLLLFEEAMKLYFQERLKWSFLPPDSGIIPEFRNRLTEAKQHFAYVLQLYPAGLWTEDAVLHIEKINIWLEKCPSPSIKK